jgi:uncharacterized protein YlaI
MEGNCGFCERWRELDFHHYIPKTLHNNKLFKKLFSKIYMRTHGVDLCYDCHHTVHEFWTEKELGKNYNTKEKIMGSSKFRKYLKWIVKQN